ncbi:MAG: PorV/PorQ family protein [Bacteroidota bacterium]
MMRTFLLFIVCSSVALSQGTSSGSSYLKLPIHARAAATGEAFVVDSSVFASVSLNPANAYTDESTEVLFSHSQWIQDVQADAIGVRVPTPYGALGFMILNTGVSGIEIRDVPGPPLGTFSSHSTVFQLLYANTLTQDITVGVNLKYLYEKIFVDEASGFGVDMGASYRTPVEGLSVGASLTNLGSVSAFRTNKNDLPNRIQLGGTYSFGAADLDWKVAGSWMNDLKLSESRLLFGGEVSYDRNFSFRLGYQTGYENRGFSTGAGVHYSFVKLDYAYVPFSLGFGNAHVLSIGFEL